MEKWIHWTRTRGGGFRRRGVRLFRDLMSHQSTINMITTIENENWTNFLPARRMRTIISSSKSCPSTRTRPLRPHRRMRSLELQRKERSCLPTHLQHCNSFRYAVWVYPSHLGG
jgi:hypothetical protein